MSLLFLAFSSRIWAIFVLPLPLAVWIEGERLLCWLWAAGLLLPSDCCGSVSKSRDLSHSLSPATYVCLLGYKR